MDIAQKSHNNCYTKNRKIGYIIIISLPATVLFMS